MEVILTRTRKASLPKFNLGKKTFEKIGEVASNSVVMNVRKSDQYDGKKIKANRPSTIAQKRASRSSKKIGGDVRPLIDKKHRFIQQGKSGSWRFWAKNDQVRLEPGTEWLRRISLELQKKGYRGWFGINKKARILIKKIVGARLIELINIAAKKSK